MADLADSRRWRGRGVQRDDLLGRPPAFRDAHDGKPLTPERAHWHGSGGRSVALSIGIAFAVVAAIGAVAFMVLGPSGGDAGLPAPGAAAAEGDDGPDLGVPTPGPSGNATTGLPLPTPTLPAP